MSAGTFWNQSGRELSECLLGQKTLELLIHGKAMATNDKKQSVATISLAGGGKRLSTISSKKGVCRICMELIQCIELYVTIC